MATARESIKKEQAEKIGIICDNVKHLNLQIKALGNNASAVIAKPDCNSHSEFTTAINKHNSPKNSIKKNGTN